MDVNKCKSSKDLLNEYARQAERLREQICEIREQHIKRILKLSDECRRVNRALTMQTTELKSNIERIQKQIDQLQRDRFYSSDSGAEDTESIIENGRGRLERERPLSTMLGKLLACPDNQNLGISRTMTPPAQLELKRTGKPNAGDSKEKNSYKRRSGKLDSEEVRQVAELARRLASYQNLPIHQPCISRHEQPS